MLGLVHVDVLVAGGGVELLTGDHGAPVVGQEVLVAALVLPGPVAGYHTVPPLVAAAAGVIQGTTVLETTNHQDDSQYQTVTRKVLKTRSPDALLAL